MIGDYGCVILESALFSVQLDHMNFRDGIDKRLMIPEIVTAPSRQEGETRSNLLTEKEIDAAVNDFLAIIEDFTKKASQKEGQSYLGIDDLMRQYNAKQPKNPLCIETSLRKYLTNPIREKLFSGEEFIEAHKDIDICLVYEKNLTPVFDASETPRTENAKQVVSKCAYQQGILLVHVQKTFSLPVEEYRPEAIPSEFHNTPEQLFSLLEARERAQIFISQNPLPKEASKDRILGLLTICVEQVISLTKANRYKTLHEKADRLVLSIWQILHYIKKNICNEFELKWFDKMFKDRRDDIQQLLCVDEYKGDYKGNEGAYGNSCVSRSERYNAIFDLFGDFTNKSELTFNDINNPLTLAEIKEMTNHGITSWRSLFTNHVSMSGRSHFRMQKVINENGIVEYHPLFEARRIGLMTIDEFIAGKSQVLAPGFNSRVLHVRNFLMTQIENHRGNSQEIDDKEILEARQKWEKAKNACEGKKFVKKILFEAVKHRNLEILKIAFADNNQYVHVTNNNSTLLHCAIFYGYPEIIALLLKNGADLYAKNDYDVAPINFAFMKFNNEVLKIILDYKKLNTLKSFLNEEDNIKNTDMQKNNFTKLFDDQIDKTINLII